MDPKLYTIFRSVDKDETGLLSVDGLWKAVAYNKDWMRLDTVTIRMCMDVFAPPNESSIDYDTFWSVLIVVIQDIRLLFVSSSFLIRSDR